MPGVGGQTVLYFYNVNTPPPGWTLLVPDANIRQLVIGDAVNGGSIGGVEDPVDFTYDLNTAVSTAVNTTVSVNLPATTAGHVLLQNQLPSHNHDQVGLAAPGIGVGTFSFAIEEAGAQLTSVTPTADRGGDNPHSHDIGGTAAGTGTGTGAGSGSGTLRIQPRYASGILGTLDA